MFNKNTLKKIPLQNLLICMSSSQGGRETLILRATRAPENASLQVTCNPEYIFIFTNWNTLYVNRKNLSLNIFGGNTLENIAPKNVFILHR